MDGLHRSVLRGHLFRLTVIVIAMLLVVSAGTRLGGSAQEGGANPDASPEASPAASPVAEPATESGSVTIRVLGCEAGTTADSAGPASCSALSGDVAIEIAGDGDAVTVEDSLRLSAGVFRWIRLPYGTYSITFATLPEGSTSALVASDPTASTAAEVIGDAGFDVTIDSVESSPTITIIAIP